MKNEHLLSFHVADYAKNAWKRPEIYKKFAYGVLDRCQSQCTKADKVEAEVPEEAKDAPQVSLKPKVEKMAQNHSELSKYRSSREDLSDTKWRLELTWLTKALEPALQVCRWALPTGLFNSVMLSVLPNLLGLHRAVMDEHLSVSNLIKVMVFLKF